MVVKKRQYYGFNGFHMPPVPRAPRSARRGLNLNKKKVEDSQLCAFELLASLAGKLLQESESSASSNASEANDQPIIGVGGVKCEQAEDRPLKAECLDHGSFGESAFVAESALPNSDQKCLLNEFSLAESDSILEHSSMISNSNSPEKVGADLKTIMDIGVNKGGDVLDTGVLAVENTCSLKDQMEMCMNFPALLKLDNDVALPTRREPVPNASIPKHRNDTKLGVRDDDECELSKPAFFEGGMKPQYRKRKLCYSREKYQHDTFYKRKCTDRSVVVTTDGGFSSESVCNSPNKSMTGDKNGAAVMLHGENGISSSVIGHQSPFHSKDSHVKFSIKSFRVPELFISVPETATVGSLKRTVVEAVSALLGSGLRVGVLLHGMKVRDDSRTLLQTEDPALLPCDTSQLISRSPTAPIIDSGISDALPDPPPSTNLDTITESNHESVSSHYDMRRTRRPFSVSEVEALVHAVEEIGTGRWRDVKLRSFEDANHRTYVDLKAVQAHPHLLPIGSRPTLINHTSGEDKWKTLVHTAQIAPQQRRGEPVPQELLDRVLAAHAYWSQHQAKQHGKNQAAILKITVAHAVKNGVEDDQSI
ncbi:hypothetical protein OIU78_006430 [Salix suchowensis]|nr:hypothetical protein OIU78_006430 [Salix suchowensis]